ncbi:Transcription factor spt8 [Serendipita sp. 399]|nr:Transcription factor spt8 [Serendipita sp. 399]
MSDEEEDFNEEERDADIMEEEADPEGEDEDEEMELEDADGDEDENSSSQEGSEPGDSEEGSEEETGDEGDDDEAQRSIESLPRKSPRDIKRALTKSRESSLQPPRRSISPASIRRERLQIPPVQCKSYAIEPVCAIPHPSPTNALAASTCMTHLLTGSDDGFIRNYDLFASLNGRTFLTAPQRSHCGLGDTLMRAGILRCWWPATTQEKYDAGDSSAVYSLACQSDALWALSGSANGEIHLYTVRHEPGRVHHTFTDHEAAVSTLCLSTDEKTAFSGSQDGQALQLDLDRGGLIRRFGHPGAQIAAMGLRPHYLYTPPESSLLVLPPMDETKESEVAGPVEADASAELDPSAAEIPPQSPEADNKSEGYDPLFDDVEMNTISAQPSPKASQNALGLALPGKRSPVDESVPIAPSIKHGVGLLDPITYASFSDDLLMTATFGGSLFLWDKRAPKNVGRLENDKAPPWCVSACWSATGNEIIAGRRNATVDVFDVRQFGPNGSHNPRILRTLANPIDSKTVTCVAAFPDGKFIVCASEDNIRLWNVLEPPVDTGKKKGLPPFRVIPGHHGGLVSQILIDNRSQFMVTASSARQWPGQSCAHWRQIKLGPKPLQHQILVNMSAQNVEYRGK